MTRLPSVLAPWEESLAGLSADAARAVGPLLPLLDDLIGRLDRPGGEHGEPDGYDGTTNRGDVSRLLMDEWLLAQELPDEFLRRAAEHELSFLRVARRAQLPRGQVVAVVDTGPEQLGVGRLVQLAALVVLHRRAIAAATELAVVLLGARGDSARHVAGPDGLPVALLAWLEARSTHEPVPADVATAFAAADDDDQVWLLAGPTTRPHTPPGHRRAVSCRVVRWDDAGARRLAVRVGDSTAEVEVPDPRAAVATLRGEGLFRRRADPTVTSVPTTGQGAVFHSNDARLLWRGETDQELFGCTVPGNARARRYRFKGSVLAANSLGKRLVAAVTDGHALWIEVVGKRLAHTDRIQVPLADLDLDHAAVATLLAEPPQPLHLSASNIMVRLPSGWWCLEEERCWKTGMRAVGPGNALDNPHGVYGSTDGKMWLAGRSISDLAAGPLIGPPDAGGHGAPWVAWSSDSRVWNIAWQGDVVAEIAVEERDRVIGLGVDVRRPFLLVTSESGRLVRQVSAEKVRTWTRWAGPAFFSLHPSRPWLARTTEGRITVGDLSSGETLLEITAST